MDGVAVGTRRRAAQYGSAMANPGVRRKVDDLGRVVIPAGMRRALGISEGDEVEFSVHDDRLVITRAQDHCTFCGSDLNLEWVFGKAVCWSCLGALRAKAPR